MSRYSFPSTCEIHFSNNIATKHTWMESDDESVIDPFKDYFRFIPQIYTSDCYSCHNCGGIKFNLYRGFDEPTTDVDAMDELREGHLKMQKRWDQMFNNPNDDFRLHQSDHCETLCWNGGYFRKWNQKYIHFFKHFLQYSSENQECHCFWPECNVSALNANNQVYKLFKDLADKNLISPEFSSFWKAHLIQSNYNEVNVLDEEYYPNSHGMASSLVTYTFFYSQYHQVLLSIASFIDSNELLGNSRAIDRIYSTLENLRNRFSNMYNRCLRFHPNPKIAYERGLLKMHSGDTEGALIDISRLMHMAESPMHQNNITITSDMYQQEGQLYADLGIYDKAITALTEAIRLDPNNRGAYFSRAQAYFESGQFDQSLSDYLNSQDSTDIKPKLKPPLDVKNAIVNGLLEGCKESAINFCPSLCASAYGLGTSLWVLAEHPIDSTIVFMNACYEISKNTWDFYRNIKWEDIENCSLELERLHGNYNRLSDVEKAHLTAYTIGKFGVNVFAGSTAVKSFTAYKKMKDANKLCNLEAMALSPANKDLILTSAQKHALKREFFFRDVTLHVDKHNKHIIGKHNYEQGKSIFEHPDPEKLLNKFAGKGEVCKNRIFGRPDYREKVNFNEFIGFHINKTTGVKTTTTWGEIRYTNNGGAHIIPTFPE